MKCSIKYQLLRTGKKTISVHYYFYGQNNPNEFKRNPPPYF